MTHNHRRSRAHACHAACEEMRAKRGATWDIGHVRVVRKGKASDAQAYVNGVLTACFLGRYMDWEERAR